MTNHNPIPENNQGIVIHSPIILVSDRSKPRVYRIKLSTPEDYYTENEDLCIRTDLLHEAAINCASIGFLCYMLLFPPEELWTAGKLTLSSKGGIESCASSLKEICQAGYIELLDLPNSFGWVYLLEAEANGVTRYKIGESIDPYARFEDIQSHSPVKLTLKHLIQTQNRKNLELLLHKKYSSSKIQLGKKKGEWFELNPLQVEEILMLEGDRT